MNAESLRLQVVRRSFCLVGLRGSGSVQQVVTGLVLALVPALAGHRIIPVVLTLVAALFVPPRLAVTLLAYSAPSSVGLPWPTHCVIAWVAWLVMRSAATAPKPERSRAGMRLVTVTLLVLLGVAAGAMTAVVARDSIRRMIVFVPFGHPGPQVLGLLVVAAAVVNAVGEELMWRRLLPAVSANVAAGRVLLVQALSFGLAHWNGIPSGPLGAISASVYSVIVYAVWRAHGFLAALLVHLITDLVIFWYVVRHAALAWSG